MAFPNDLSNVSAFKVHPAIGVARLANNDDFYEFFDYQAVRDAGNAQSLTYMTVQEGHHWMMRQAVRFRVFAYDEDGKDLGELSSDVMTNLGIDAVWHVTVANRKLNNFSDGSTPVIEASGSASGSEVTRLEGANPWRESNVWLGDLHGNGMFVPPKGGVYRRDKNTVIPPYGSHTSDNGVQDTTSDGMVTVELSDINDVPVIPAGVLVAPQQHSPDVNPGDINNGRNLDFIAETRKLLNIPEDAPLTGAGYAMDFAIMSTMNAEYAPGMEICLNRGNALPDPAGAFFPRGQNHIAEAEIRPAYGENGADFGALTAGLCSAWQTDLNACLNYWTSEFPNEMAYDDAPDTRKLARREFAAAGPQMGNPEDLNAYIDMMGVARDLDDDPFFLFGTERDGNDDAGAQPQPPFLLDAPQ
ncbi:hypothetical protein FMN63_11450 [Stappia sp. BW2]|uniref:LodA/GoxA family CTQ-dependent oxidase n=1 Tax=Stappia sp. BW2 TaxID=2592622 RepID=UPI0011DEE3AD|nr:LodA/GoxA family CTQ-dependent oxidase [Stappia sp. BW2]TYC68291.1 hypothetical protein FMN63_11450 [Stappia sp. BW2]